MFLKIVRYILLLIVGLVFLLLLGHYVPVHSNIPEADAEKDSVYIMVSDNGVHTSFILPVSGAGVDWSEFIELEKINSRASGAYEYIEFGWGEKRFYMNTPTWRDLRFRIAVPAMFWPTTSAMHVTGLSRRPVRGRLKEVPVSEAQYKKLTGFIKESFDTSKDTVSFIDDGYHNHDGFFESDLQYHLFNTCNHWTAKGLREAGVSTPLLPFFPSSVMRHLPDAND